jgi:hypothetical protein
MRVERLAAFGTSTKADALDGPVTSRIGVLLLSRSSLDRSQAGVGLMNEEQLVAQYLAIIARLGLNDEAAAAVTGLAPHTIRLMRARRALPRTQRCREQLARFVAANFHAQTRSDVRLVGREERSTITTFGERASDTTGVKVGD